MTALSGAVRDTANGDLEDLGEAQRQDDAKASRAKIIDHFSTTHFEELSSFRGLCNVLKAASINAAVRVWQKFNKGRPVVCDLGCGKGGDLNKWMMHRPKRWIGLDGSAACIEEAAKRHSQSVARGRGNMQTQLHTLDLCDTTQRYPLEDASIDIMTSLFFIHFASESLQVFTHVLDEISRVLKPGGVVLILVPDGNRIWSLLESPCSVQHGHFTLSRCDADWSLTSNIFGLTYQFALAGNACSEYVLFPRYLEEQLSDRGFETAFADAGLNQDESSCHRMNQSMGAQTFFTQSPDRAGLMRSMLRREGTSYYDWWSLGLFRVLLVRLPS